MKRKKWLKIIGIGLLLILLVVGGLVGYSAYTIMYRFQPKEGVFTEVANYIDPEKATNVRPFEICSSERIFDYYNADGASFSTGKNGLRKYVLEQYENTNKYQSGYFNVRFIVNCEGVAGNYIAQGYDLDLNPIAFDPSVAKQLFKITTELESWDPIIIDGQGADAYVYISYRIEDGKLVEIIP